MMDLETADALHLAGDIDAAADAYRRVIAADRGNVAALNRYRLALFCESTSIISADRIYVAHQNTR